MRRDATYREYIVLGNSDDQQSPEPDQHDTVNAGSSLFLCNPRQVGWESVDGVGLVALPGSAEYGPYAAGINAPAPAAAPGRCLVPASRSINAAGLDEARAQPCRDPR